MARGSIRKHERDDGPRYEAVVDLGPHPVSGKRRQRSKSFRTRREAERGLTRLLDEIERGVAVDRSPQTVGEVLQYWLETYARSHVNDWTYAGYERTIRLHLTPDLGALPVQKLTPGRIQALYAAKLAAGVGPRSVRLMHLRLSQALRQAQQLGFVAQVATARVTPPRDRAREMQVWDGDQTRRFLATAAQHSHHGPLWLVAAWTGMRRGELLGLRWRDVAWDRGVLHVQQAVALRPNGAYEIRAPKHNSRRSVEVPAQVLAALRAHRARQSAQRLAAGDIWQDNDLLFPTEIGTALNPNNLRRDYERLVKLAGVPRIRIHDTRHTNITLAIAAGANIKAISRRVGHRDIVTTLDKYTHLLPDQEREVVERLGTILDPLPDLSNDRP